jgi:hypothetical protein
MTTISNGAELSVTGVWAETRTSTCIQAVHHWKTTVGKPRRAQFLQMRSYLPGGNFFLRANIFDKFVFLKRMLLIVCYILNPARHGVAIHGGAIHGFSGDGSHKRAAAEGLKPNSSKAFHQRIPPEDPPKDPPKVSFGENP